MPAPPKIPVDLISKRESQESQSAHPSKHSKLMPVLKNQKTSAGHSRTCFNTSQTPDLSRLTTSIPSTLPSSHPAGCSAAATAPLRTGQRNSRPLPARPAARPGPDAGVGGSQEPDHSGHGCFSCRGNMMKHARKSRKSKKGPRGGWVVEPRRAHVEAPGVARPRNPGSPQDLADHGA